ncbi:Serine/threonine-protein kinase rio2 [Spatholobus suberectus]|nr:Serine/threonine-protein kinase rio2 [Spatholobus suberectus]
MVQETNKHIDSPYSQIRTDACVEEEVNEVLEAAMEYDKVYFVADVACATNVTFCANYVGFCALVEIFEVAYEDGIVLAMKLHRLVRVSFRVVKSMCDYLRHRSSYNWLHLSRLAVLKEFAFMKIDDDEKITMIDFPQMVSVSHRNAQIIWLLNQLSSYLVPLLCFRFNLSFQESIDDIDGSDEGRDEGGKPCFSSIKRSAGFLDRELAASGFTRKDEEDIQRYFEGGAESDTNSDSEGVDLVEDLNEADTEDGDSSHLLERNEGYESQPKEESCEACESSAKMEVTMRKTIKMQKENEAELVKSLNKQRRRAIAAHRGRKTVAARNSYKDKAGRSSHNSKIQKQLSSW